MNRQIKIILKKIIPNRLWIYLVHCWHYANERKEKNLREEQYPEYLKSWYHKRTGDKLDLENPVTYTQKQQWLKLYDQSPVKTELADKYAVRKYLQKNGFGELLIPIISIDGKDCWENAFDIDFEKLPKQFVLKCNHGSGYNIIVRDKSLLGKREIKTIKKRLNMWLKENFAFKGGLELQYRDIKPLIYIEAYMAIDDDLPDYKFMCFSGKVKYVWVDKGRFTCHRRTVYDLNYQPLPFTLIYERLLEDEKPQNFEAMIETAGKLCGDWRYVRVDLYSINGKIYFGEFTFSSENGLGFAKPDEYNKILGDEISIA